MNLEAIFIVGFVVLGIYKLFELFVRKKERMILIEKLPAILNANEAGKVIKFPEISFIKRNSGSGALRIALLLVGVGLGCLLAFFLQYSAFPLSDWTVKDWEARTEMAHIRVVLYFSCIAICGGLCLLVAYLIERRQIKRQRD